MKKTLVTGAGGFIGSTLCEHLVRKGHKLRAFVHYNSQGQWGWLEQSPLAKEMEVFSGDLRDFDSVSLAMKDVDQVFHLGALIGIPYSYSSPLAYVRTNIEGTYNILEAARRNETRRVLVTSTSEVYGTAQYVPIDEAHPLQPQSPYSATKIAADNLALSYYNSFNTPVVVCRPFNTYGPRQSARAIIPTIATQLLAKKPVIELGNLEPSRDLTFVEDTAAAMKIVADTDAFVGKAVNIGVGSGVTIGELYEKIAAIVGHRAEIRQAAERVRPDKSEVMRLLSNNDYLRKTTGWAPQFDLDRGLKLTVAWLEKQLHLYKPDVYGV